MGLLLALIVYSVGAPFSAAVATSASTYDTGTHVYDTPAPSMLSHTAETVITRGSPVVLDAAWSGRFVSILDCWVAAKAEAGDVNAVGGTHNCVACAIAGDSTLAGRPASALNPTPGFPISGGNAMIEAYASARWRVVSGRSAIEAELLRVGDGARGIVYGARPDGTAHVFNAVVQRGQVNFVDFQSGGAASFSGFNQFAFVRTN